VRVDERPAEDLAGLVAGIDRRERIDTLFDVVDGVLRAQSIASEDVPPWSPADVSRQVAFTAPIVARGAALLTIDDGAGVAIVEPRFEPSLSWLAWLHVSRPARRRGLATALWRAAVERSVAAGASAMYVSATPTGSAVGFYLRQGCVLAVPPHAELLAHEPEDIHLVCELRRPTA